MFVEPDYFLKHICCPDCKQEILKRFELEIKTKDDLIEAVNNKFGEGVYDLNCSDFVQIKKRFYVRCIKHDKIFKTNVYRLLFKFDVCPECANETRRNGVTTNIERFIKKSKEIYGEYAFDYSQAIYVDQSTPLWLKCNKHNEWFQVKPKNHYTESSGCPVCAKEWNDELNKNKRLTNEEFILMMEERHPGEFLYIHTNYVNMNTPVTITCKIHGDFKANPGDLLGNLSGCPKCHISDLERDVSDLLYSKNIYSIYGAHTDWLRTKNRGGHLELDFYIPSLNVAIECQGLQHFKSVDFFGGDEGLKSREERDELKRKLCEEHNIPILYYANYEYDFPYKVYTDINELYQAIIEASNDYNKDMVISNTVNSFRIMTRNSFDASIFMTNEAFELNEKLYKGTIV